MPAALPILGNIAVQLAIGVGLSLVSGLIAPQQAQAATAAEQGGFTTSMTVGQAHPVSAVFGRGVASGNLIYVNSYGANDEYCQLVIDIGYGWHESLDTLLLDGKPVTLAGSNSDARGQSVVAYTVAGTPYMWVKYYDGRPGQIADPELIARANPSGRWGDFYRATGHAYLIVTLRDNADLYSSSAFPAIGSVWKGLKLYDWRRDSTVAGGSGSHRWGTPSTYEWTDNPYVIRWNWRRGIYVGSVRVLGLGYPFYAQDVAYYTSAANIADEDVYDPVTDTTFARYAYGREITDAEDKMGILSEIDDCCCGTSFKRGGADAPLPASQQVSVGTLLDTDRVAGGAVTADRWGLVSARKTAWSGQYVAPDNNWQATPYQTRINAALETLIGGRRTQPLNQPYETLEPRAQMRAEIAARRQSFAGTRTETFGPKARQYEVGDCITRRCSWGDITMIVTGKARTDDRLGVVLTLAEWSNSIVPASGDSFVTEPEGPGVAPANPNRMVTVTGAKAVAYAEVGGGATHAAIKFTIDAITDQSVDNWYVRYWPSAGSDAADGKTLTGTRYNTVLVSPPLAPETEYAWQIDIVTTPWRASVPTPVAYVTTGSESVPAIATDVTKAQLVAALQAQLNWYTTSLNDLAENLQAIAGTLQDQDAANYDDKRQVLANVTSQLGNVRATITSVAETLATETTAAAALATAAQATADLGTASGLWKIEAESAPSGVDVKVGSYLSTDVSGVVTNAFETLEIASDGTSTKTVVCDIWQTLNAGATAGMIVDNRTGNISMGSLV